MNEVSKSDRERTAKLWRATSVLWMTAAVVISLVIIIIMFFAAAESARAATGNVEFPQRLFGILIFTGFRHGQLLGMHAYPGLLIFPIFVFAVGLACLDTCTEEICRCTTLASPRRRC